MQRGGKKASVAVAKKEEPGFKKPTKSCYMSVAEPLPESVTLKEIIDSLPKEVFAKSNIKAIRTCITSFVFTALGLYCIYLSPWYLLPIAWIFCGTAACGLFVIGHDCAHRSLFPSKTVNDIVGTFCHALIVYPYHPWRHQHNHHHANTNRLHVDNAWQPTNPEKYKNAPWVVRQALHLVKGPFWWVGSIGHLFMEHFDINMYKESHKAGVRTSWFACAVVALTVWPFLVKFTGVSGLLSYYVIPWLVFHFWMSTFTLVHHTIPHIPFLPDGEWNATAARISFTVHADYPFWVEFLCHDINVHIPHHLSTAVPSYNLKPAHRILKEKWGKYMHEARFGFELMYDIAVSCHMYHDKNYYQTFAAFWNAATE